jgi:hypothetical protein
LLGYAQWRSFENAIKKAVTSCKQSGNEPGYHFARARKMVDHGEPRGSSPWYYHFVRARKMIDSDKGAVCQVTDYHLSRFACYLIAQNGDWWCISLGSLVGAGVATKKHKKPQNRAERGWGGLASLTSGLYPVT